MFDGRAALSRRSSTAGGGAEQIVKTPWTWTSKEAPEVSTMQRLGRRACCRRAECSYALLDEEWSGWRRASAATSSDYGRRTRASFGQVAGTSGTRFPCPGRRFLRLRASGGRAGAVDVGRRTKCGRHGAASAVPEGPLPKGAAAGPAVDHPPNLWALVSLVVTAFSFIGA